MNPGLLIANINALTVLSDYEWVRVSFSPPLINLPAIRINSIFTDNLIEFAEIILRSGAGTDEGDSSSVLISGLFSRSLFDHNTAQVLSFMADISPSSIQVDWPGLVTAVGFVSGDLHSGHIRWNVVVHWTWLDSVTGNDHVVSWRRVPDSEGRLRSFRSGSVGVSVVVLRQRSSVDVDVVSLVVAAIWVTRTVGVIDFVSVVDQ